MIDWKIEIADKQIGSSLYFPNFITQEYLLPFFDIGGNEIDEYGECVYGREDLMRLRKVLRNWIERYKPNPNREFLVDTLMNGKGKVKASEIISLMEKTEAMAGEAIEKGGVIRFSGD